MTLGRPSIPLPSHGVRLSTFYKYTYVPFTALRPLATVLRKKVHSVTRPDSDDRLPLTDLFGRVFFVYHGRVVLTNRRGCPFPPHHHHHHQGGPIKGRDENATSFSRDHPQNQIDVPARTVIRRCPVPSTALEAVQFGHKHSVRLQVFS